MCTSTMSVGNEDRPSIASTWASWKEPLEPPEPLELWLTSLRASLPATGSSRDVDPGQPNLSAGSGGPGHPWDDRFSTRVPFPEEI